MIHFVQIHLHLTREMRISLQDFPSISWFVICWTEKWWERDRKSSHQTNLFHWKSTKQQQRWMLTSVIPPPFRTDTVSCPVLVGSVFGFIVFQSLGQNISQFISEFVIITHFAFRAWRTKEVSRLETVLKPLGSAFRFLPSTSNWSIHFKNRNKSSDSFCVPVKLLNNNLITPFAQRTLSTWKT